MYLEKKYVKMLAGLSFQSEKIKKTISSFSRLFSSGYDHVLLTSYLVPQLFEAGFRPKIEKRGNKVTSLSTRCGIHFRDVTKLLAPSTNLRSFGKLFGLEQSKAHFPFKALTSVESLERPGLPEFGSEEWISDLTEKAATEDEVSEAMRLFEAAGCNTLGDYLKAYLKLDVVILFEATQQWRLTLKSQIGIDFIEVGKFTISSLSFLAGIKSGLEKRGRVGHFFPNNSQNYRLLRTGMRGQVCL
jgi:hypothetical protein